MLTGSDNPPEFVTVLCLGQEQVITKESLKKTIEYYDAIDDVFCREFLRGVILVSEADGGAKLGHDASELLKSLGTIWIEHLQAGGAEMMPASGPYLVHDRKLYEIWRLYDDSHDAFVTSLLQGREQVTLLASVSPKFPS